MEELAMDMKKESLFRRILNCIYGWWPRKSTIRLEAVSKFQMVVKDIPEDDPEYDNVSIAAKLCEEALKLARHRIQLVSKVAKIEEQMGELESYGKLTDEEATQLKNLLNGLISTTKDRDVLRYQLIDFDKGLTRLEDLEEDANLAMPQIQEAEKMQRILKRDVGLLIGEKTDLEYERGVLETGLDFINKFVVGIVILLGIVCIYLAFLFMFTETSIFLPTTILVMATIIMSAVLYAFRQRISYEMKLNIKKQNRAVELLNKKNVVLVHYTNFLHYVYNKYQVRNSQMLRENLKEFSNYKYVTGRIDSIRNVMYETERQIEQFLREKKIDSGRFTIEQFANTINIENKQAFYKDLEKQKSELDAQLNDMDTKHKSIWQLLDELNEQDNSQGKAIGILIQLYFDEVGKIFVTIDNEEEVV